MLFRITDLAILGVLAASVTSKPLDPKIGTNGLLPPLTYSPIVEEFPPNLPFTSVTHQCLINSMNYPTWYSAVLSSEADLQFLDWEYPMNETNYQVDDSETSVSPNSIPNGVMGYCNGEDGAYGSTYQLYYPKINQCYNISPKPNVGVMNFSPFTENTFCFFSEANCRGERVCVYRSLSNPSSDGLIVPATTNMLSNGILSTLALSPKPADGYVSPLCSVINPPNTHLERSQC
ncbi:hypothetical protein K493DRAFT_307678 [Basidiobolus meristosporus CBS 931.73]|uniref:Uncharacterized protein n=1 Tax=Basidiobolus meristosporus CBS 931.73 TaxID=1314790 RepID=A0A1Y1XCB9_9FUNG|nr:hypothetical protein K493DRAFT_307678 [Basidiobolus meristosporus CBS 931.73]|eukprot:ORX83076.1 hypothetical protein K493DRAFT_307678 [Basidiobolus meristosporus CBS 931.73]